MFDALLSRLRLAVGAPRLAVVLGGGGTRGGYEVGVIDALLARRIRPDVVVGTSIGAVNGAWLAFHPTANDASDLLATWLEATSDVVVPPPLQLVFQVLQGRDHVNASAGLAALIDRGVQPGTTIESAPVPLSVTAVVAGDGRPRRLTSGPLREAVLASAAVPGLYPAVEIAGDRLADGGMVANCDLEAAVLLGATDVLAVDVMGGGGWTAGSDLWTIAERSLDVMLGRQTDVAFAAMASRARIAVLRAPARIMPRFGSLKETEELFEAGREAGAAWLDRVWGRGRVTAPGISVAASR